MGYSTFGKRVSRFFRKREVRGRLAQLSDPRSARGRRWPLLQVLEMVLGALLQIRSCHRLDEHTRTGPPLRMGEVRCKSAVSPDGVIRTLAIDGKCLWSGRLNLFEV